MRFSKMVLWTLAGGLSAAGVLAGCGSDETKSGSTTGDAAGCEPTAECKADVGVESECLGLVDNTGSATPALRISALTITQPPALAAGAVKKIVDDAVALNMGACKLVGTGTFSWILQFEDGKLKTGGAKPAADPKAGYCFVNEMVGGQTVAPITVDAPIGADGSFSADVGADVVVPIYLDASASSVVLLPLNGARLYDGTLSADQNCVGKHNGEALSPVNLCLPEEGVPSFVSGAKLDGYITLEQADEVIIDVLNESFCVLLAPNPIDYATDTTPKKCTRDGEGEISFAGDWCSTTNMPATADCADAIKLGATFAASAVTVHGDCK